MEMKFAQCVNKGMQRDYAMNTASQEFAYENKNIRITTSGNESFLAITNERSTEKITDINKDFELTFNRIKLLGTKIMSTYPVNSDVYLYLYSANEFEINELGKRVRKKYKVCIKQGETEADTGDIDLNNFPLWGFEVISDYRKDFKYYYLSYNYSYDSETDVESLIPEYPDSSLLHINMEGEVLGTAVINNYLILFNHDSNNNLDYIYRITINDDVEVDTVYQGKLGFDPEYPIECTTSYESEDVQKVYWVDGKNQPRMINITKLNQTSETTNVDFVPPFNEGVNVEVRKRYEGAGLFPSGVIQYYITYYSKFGQETNVVYNTPIFNISPQDRGGEEDVTQTCSFDITIKNVDIKYDYIRIYSLIRTTKDSVPSVSIVKDITIQKDNSNYIYHLVDTNIDNIPVAASDILFLGGNTITASTIEQKDNTLFLGNLTSLSNNEDYKSLDEVLAEDRSNNTLGVEFFNRPVKLATYHNEDYGYTPNMDASSKDRGFKYLEWYRLGLQFQNDRGEWGRVVWLGDVQNKNCYPNNSYVGNDEFINSLYDVDYDYDTISAIKYEPSSSVKNVFNTFNSKRYRLVMAEHTPYTRTIKSQGVIMPTLFNLKQRADGTCHGSSLWSTGIAINKQRKHLDNVDYLNTYSPKDRTKTPLSVQAVYPTQHLDSVLYSLNKNYGESNNLDDDSISEKLLFNIHSSAVTTKSGTKEKECYLSKIVVQIGVAGPLYVLSFTPYTINWESTVETKGPMIKAVTIRSSGRRKKGFEELITKAVALQWKDIANIEGVEIDIANIDGINPDDPVCTRVELPTADELKEAFGPNEGSLTELTLYRNGSGLSRDAVLIKDHCNEYFLDANLCDFWSPNTDIVQDVISKFRIVGEVNVSNTISNYSITMEDYTVFNKRYDIYDTNLNRALYSDTFGKKISDITEGSDTYIFTHLTESNTGITAFPLWPGISTHSLFWVHTWNQPTINKSTEETKEFESKIKTKTFGNFWKCSSVYIDNINYGTTYSTLVDNPTIYNGGNLFQKEYNNVLFPKNERRLYLYDQEGLLTTTDITKVNSLIEENSNVILTSDGVIRDTVSIKYNSTNHLLVNLGKANGLLNVLPNYSRTDNNNVLAYDGTPFTPIFNDSFDYVVEGELKEEIKNIETGVPLDGHILYIPDFNNSNCSWSIYVGGEYIGKINHNELSVLPYNSNDKIYILNNQLPYKISWEVESTSSANSFPGTITIQKIEDAALLKCNDLNISTYYIVEDNKLINASNKLSGVTNWKSSPNTESKLFLGELYIEYDETSFMGGTSENALELNTFIPISDPTPIGNTIYAFEGDTYYQQWDCLRTYPLAEEDVNKVVDVISVPLESYVNLDGDTRETRGRKDVDNIRPSNITTTINPVYSQSNNYVTGSILDEKFDISKHPTQYWWSLTKTPNSDIDVWTGINLTSIAELDGDKGPLTKIKRWNNSLFAFQDKAIAAINFNNQTTISTQEGIPVEISNSGKVQGHYYLTTNNGCKNKWSIVESPNGLYFIDSYNKAINVLGEGIKSLSMINLFQDWIEKHEIGNIWSSEYKNGKAFKSFYDPIHKDVYFANGEDCLCYNELLEQFVSFYDYEKLEHMAMLNNSIYGISDGTIYRMFEGSDYCNLFGKQCDYYIQYKINNEPFVDKTWTNIEYRADVFNEGNIQTNEYNGNSIISNETFNFLKVWNEYQNGELDLNTVKFSYIKDARPRFRVWRTNIPRANNGSNNKWGLDRIRNPWIMLELKKSSNTNKRMEFHDLIIKYVI